MIGPTCTGPSFGRLAFERLPFEMSKDSRSKDGPAQVEMFGLFARGQCSCVEAPSKFSSIVELVTKVQHFSMLLVPSFVQGPRAHRGP